MIDVPPAFATLPAEILLRRFNVRTSVSATRTMMFAHGFGCDQNMWRYVATAFEPDFRTVLFDYVGAGGADLAAYDPEKYGSLDGYAQDVIALARALDITNGIFVGHSVSAVIGLLAVKAAPELFSALVMIGPSPRYIDDDDYIGGFSHGQIMELLDFLDSNHDGWSQTMAPAIMATPDDQSLGKNWRQASAAPIPKWPNSSPESLSCRTIGQTSARSLRAY